MDTLLWLLLLILGLMTYLMIELPTYLSSYVVYTHNTEMPSSVTLSPAYPYMSTHVYIYIPYIMYLDTNYKFAAPQVSSSKHFPLHGKYMFTYILTQRVSKGHLT